MQPESERKEDGAGNVRRDGKVVRKRFRITIEQQSHIEEQCKRYGIKESEFLRRLIDADRGKAVPAQTQEEFILKKQLIYEINRIGNNINQIVKNANMHFYTGHEKRKLFAMMKKVMELLENNGKGEAENGTEN